MDDLEFVQSCAKADSHTWEEFIQRYSRLIYSTIHGVFKRKFPDQARNSHVDDVFQEFFLLLTKNDFAKLKTFEGRNGCSLASWLRQVAVNLSLDYIRKIKPMVSLEEQSAAAGPLKDLLADSLHVPRNGLSESETIAGLKGCIDELETEGKFFLELHFEQGLSLEEVREALKISRGAVDMRKARIVKLLKDCFRRKGFLLDS